jgi:hypothetical protein
MESLAQIWRRPCRAAARNGTCPPINPQGWRVGTPALSCSSPLEAKALTPSPFLTFTDQEIRKEDSPAPRLTAAGIASPQLDPSTASFARACELNRQFPAIFPFLCMRQQFGGGLGKDCGNWRKKRPVCQIRVFIVSNR